LYSQRVVDQNRAKLEEKLGFSLQEHSLNDVEDFRYRMRDIDWTEDGTPSRALTPEEQSFVLNELYMSRISFNYWIRRYCLILTAEKRLEPLNPWPSQKMLFDILAEEEEAGWQEESYKKIRGILLKSRQVGGTAASEALVAHMTFLNPNTQGIIASDHPDNSLKLWQTFMRMYDNLPGWMKPHREAKVKAQNLYLDRLASDVIVGSGNQKTTLGQGMTVDVAHLTEVSTWDAENWVRIDEDLLPAFDSSRKHHSLIILESTGAGAKGNWFYEQFEAGRRGDSKFKPIFIAWYLRPDWKERSDGVTFSESTKLMAQRVLQETGTELSREQLAWYQWKRRELESKDMLELFYQEFPSTIEEAFQTGLRSVFSLELRAKIRDSVKPPIAVYDVRADAPRPLKAADVREFLLDTSAGKADNRLVVWELAKPGYTYVVGVDVSYGHDGGDSSAIEVIRIGNKWSKDEQVAEYRGTISPLDLAKVVDMVGKIYTDKYEALPAKVAVECNPGSPGIVTQNELQRRGYTHFYIWKRPLKMDGGWTNEYGWWTTNFTRPIMTETGVDYIKKGWLVINSPFTVEEMTSFVNTGADKGKRHYGHAPGYHDDRIIALFIAVTVAHENDSRNIAEDRRRHYEMLMAPAEKVTEFQSTGESWEQSVQKWEDSLIWGA
jgi:hypothetical protein